MLTYLARVPMELDSFEWLPLSARTGSTDAIAPYAIDFAAFNQPMLPFVIDRQGGNSVGVDWQNWTVGGDRYTFQVVLHNLDGLPLVNHWMQHYVQTVLTSQKPIQPCHSLSLELQTHALQPVGLA